MALLFDLEPPSPEDKPGDKNNSKNGQSAAKIKALKAKFSLLKGKSAKRLSFLSQKTWPKISRRFEVIRQKIRTFFIKLADNKIAPHIAISFLFAVVAFSNINDRVQAYNLTHEINNLDPNVELGIVSDIDQFTPSINNQSDTKAVENSITASSYSSGFVYNAAPTDTQITARTEPLPDNSKDTVYYVVRNNDTLSGIGWQFGVKLATLAYTNDLSNNDLIKPGTRLKIPPRGYETPATLIAQKQASKVAATQAGKLASAKTAAQKSAISRPAGSIRNAYPFGWCTYYVATRRAVPGQWGNAGQWLNSAQRDGYPTGSSAVAGAIVVMRESIWGHVAYVESVDGGQMTISEMNAPIWGVRTTRTVSVNQSDIKGFIY